MKNHWKILLSLSLMLLLTGSLVLAQDAGQGPPPEPGQGMGGPLGFLEPETLDAVRDIVKEHLKDIYPTMQLLKAREAELNILIFADQPDEAAIEAKIAEVAQIQAQLFTQKVALRRQLFEVTGMPIPDMGGGNVLRSLFMGAGDHGGGFGPGRGRGMRGPGMSGIDDGNPAQEFAFSGPDMY